MRRKYRMHKENIQVGRVIGNDYIRSRRQFSFLYFLYIIKAKDPHHPAPHHKDFEAFFLPGLVTQYNEHEGIEDDCKKRKNDSYIQFPEKRQNANKQDHDPKIQLSFALDLIYPIFRLK